MLATRGVLRRVPVPYDLESELSYYVPVILLMARSVGLSMGAVAAARSTKSSFSDYGASSHVPDLFVLDGVINPAI
jgi:hypothetical protein